MGTFSHPPHAASASLATAPKPILSNYLSGHKALVTGANSGIGRATALALATAGADVIVNYISHSEAAEEVAHQILKLGRSALPIRADVGDERSVKAMFRTAVSHCGTLHILVSNAGVQRDAPITEMTLEQWDTAIRVNLTGQFLCIREAAREFLRRDIDRSVSVAAGKIVCMSSVHQAIPWAGHANYAASKGGVMMLMKSVAQELAPHRIRVNAIAPGAIRTSINQDAWSTSEAYTDLMRLVPYGRIGEPEDIAGVAAWLASDASDYITGATIFVDGGMILYPGFAIGG